MLPLTRVSCFAILAVFLSFGNLQVLLTSALLLLFFMVVSRRVNTGKTIRMLSRMRWLFLSILIIYLWLSPDSNPDRLWWQTLLPSYEGLLTGLHRVAAIALMILAVNCLITTIPRGDLVGIIVRISRPLVLIGISTERLAVRLILVFEAVPQVQGDLGKRLEQPSREENWWRDRAAAVCDLMETVLRNADNVPLHRVEVTKCAWPTPGEWLYPLFLAAGLTMIQVWL